MKISIIPIIRLERRNLRQHSAALAVGGIPEQVHDGITGFLTLPGDAA